MQTYPAATVAKQLSSTFTCMKTYRGAEVMKYSTLKRLPGSAASKREMNRCVCGTGINSQQRKGAYDAFKFSHVELPKI